MEKPDGAGSRGGGKRRIKTMTAASIGAMLAGAVIAAWGAASEFTEDVIPEPDESVQMIVLTGAAFITAGGIGLVMMRTTEEVAGNLYQMLKGHHEEAMKRQDERHEEAMKRQDEAMKRQDEAMKRQDEHTGQIVHTLEKILSSLKSIEGKFDRP